MNTIRRQPWFQRGRGYSSQCGAKDYWFTPMESSYIIGGITLWIINYTIRDVQRQLNGKLRDIYTQEREILQELRKLHLKEEPRKDI